MDAVDLGRDGDRLAGLSSEAEVRPLASAIRYKSEASPQCPERVGRICYLGWE